MKKTILDKLACPACRGELESKNLSISTSGEIKSGMLYCSDCAKIVAAINFGKFDFIRYSETNTFPPLNICNDFTYKRFAWSTPSVNYLECEIADPGWFAEGYWGALRMLSNKSEIKIISNAEDIALRFLSNNKSGSVKVRYANDQELSINLSGSSEPEVKSYSIFSNIPGEKIISIKPDVDNIADLTGEIYFMGYDAAIPGACSEFGENRGNQFPEAYKWILNNLSEDAVAIDCGSGDRQFPDKRVVSFEYMPFELPSIYGEGHALPFKDNSFDAVFSQAVMEHMEEPYKAASELVRVLKPGGIIYIESAFMQPYHGVPYHFFNTTPSGLESLFIKAGLEIYRKEWFGSIYSNMDWLLASSGNKLNFIEKKFLSYLKKRIEAGISYENLKNVASGVSLWGAKNDNGYWKRRLDLDKNSPSYRY